MRSPTIAGVIDRRILLNYRVQPEILAAQLPGPFRPQLYSGWGMAGVCLIRLREIRPQWLPGWCGIGSENAAFRAAVEWDSPAGVQSGVFVWRRVTSSRLNALAGGRIFPGTHDRRTFQVAETSDTFSVRIEVTANSVTELEVQASLAKEFDSQMFDSLTEAGGCHCGGSLGFSPARKLGSFEGLLLEMENPIFQPLQVSQLRTSFFDDRSKFPAGSIHLDHALLMRNIRHRWISQPNLSAIEFSDYQPAVCHTAASSRL